jgi:cob(I)alamin adenosyltransferase
MPWLLRKIFEHKQMDNAQVQVYTGNGKGKTTAALGLCFRALGHSMSVCVVQFRKNQLCGEHAEAEKVGLKVVRCPSGRKGNICAFPCPLIIEARRMLSEKLDLLVLDEIMAAISHGCVSVDEVLELLDEAHGATEIILTGRDAPRELIERADLATNMEEIKHYYSQGLSAREGIEY